MVEKLKQKKWSGEVIVLWALWVLYVQRHRERKGYFYLFLLSNYNLRPNNLEAAVICPIHYIINKAHVRLTMGEVSVVYS